MLRLGLNAQIFPPTHGRHLVRDAIAVIKTDPEKEAYDSEKGLAKMGDPETASCTKGRDSNGGPSSLLTQLQSNVYAISAGSNMHVGFQNARGLDRQRSTASETAMLGSETVRCASKLMKMTN